jgi:FAD synthase
MYSQLTTMHVRFIPSCEATKVVIDHSSLKSCLKLRQWCSNEQTCSLGRKFVMKGMVIHGTLFENRLSSVVQPCRYLPQPSRFIRD